MKLRPESTLGMQFDSGCVISSSALDGLELSERADIGCLLLTAGCEAQDVVDRVSVAARVHLPMTARIVDTTTEHLALWLSPRSWLVQCRVGEEIELVSRVNAAFPDKRLHAALFTDYLSWFNFRGDGAEELLQEGSFISLERNGLSVGRSKRTLIAGIAAVIVRQTELAWLIAIERSRARYFVDWLEAARSTVARSEQLPR